MRRIIRILLPPLTRSSYRSRKEKDTISINACCTWLAVTLCIPAQSYLSFEMLCLAFALEIRHLLVFQKFKKQGLIFECCLEGNVLLDVKQFKLFLLSAAAAAPYYEGSLEITFSIKYCVYL